MTEATQTPGPRGAKAGNRNALRHGLFTREAIEARRAARDAKPENDPPQDKAVRQ